MERWRLAGYRGGVSPAKFESIADMNRYLSITAILLFASSAFAGDCISIEQAARKIGSNACVSGKVLQVGHSKGTTFLDFCADVQSCPFVVVVFASDLRDVGDVDKLADKDIQVNGRIEEYDGRAEIILKDLKQLRGEAAKLPPLPKNYDVEKHGKFSPKSSLPAATKTKKVYTKKPDLGGTADE